VPFADWILFRSATENRVILNIGGIANVTILTKGCTIDDVVGFDTGPGNCVSDWLMREHGGVDVGGERATRGRASAGDVERLMSDEYFARPAPKSTDGPAMLDRWNRNVRDASTLDDQLATAAAWVGASIAKAIAIRIGSGEPKRLLVAGGGSKNTAIMRHLPDAVPTDSLGVPSQAREAMAFAILGCATVDRVCANVTRVTGASRPVILGAIYPGR
jgi:anhydro-N-acetylmuramic acid kinase